MRIEHRKFRISGLVTLAALSLCQIGQGADFQGSFLERIRNSRTKSDVNNSSGATSLTSRRAQVTPLGTPKVGTTPVQPQRVMNFGPADIIEDVDKSLKKQLDPNAGHTLGMRKKKPGSSTSAGTGLSVGGKFDPNASSSRAGIDPNAGHTLGMRKKKVPSPTGTNTPAPPNGGSGQAPQNPAPQTPDPQNPAPTGGVGFPWPELVGQIVPYVVQQTPIYESPVYVESAPQVIQSAPQVIEEVVVSEPATDLEEQTKPAVGVDLVLEDIKLAAPATILAGPAYEVTFRNQSLQRVGAFRAMLAVGLDDKPGKDAPKVTMEIAGLEAGEVGKVTLRLPIAVMKMASADKDEATIFSHLFVAIDSTNVLRELDESNNHAVVERVALESGAE